MTALKQHLSPSKICKTLDITGPSLRHLILLGELKATKISIGKRTHYRVTEDSLNDFLQRRSTEQEGSHHV